jgi:hypothetical protein
MTLKWLTGSSGKALGPLQGTRATRRKPPILFTGVFTRKKDGSPEYVPQSAGRPDAKSSTRLLGRRAQESPSTRVGLPDEPSYRERSPR